jgi:beta-phosphoglucomutase
VAFPPEQAWRDALAGLADPSHFTSGLIQAEVAGKPHASGALAALRALGVFDAARQAASYAARKQARLEQLIARGDVEAFPDAIDPHMPTDWDRFEFDPVA